MREFVMDIFVGRRYGLTSDIIFERVRNHFLRHHAEPWLSEAPSLVPKFNVTRFGLDIHNKCNASYYVRHFYRCCFVIVSPGFRRIREGLWEKPIATLVCRQKYSQF